MELHVSRTRGILSGQTSLVVPGSSVGPLMNSQAVTFQTDGGEEFNLFVSRLDPASGRASLKTSGPVPGIY